MTRDRRVLRSLATFGMAVFGPIALLSGLVAFASIPRGAPPFVVGVFVSSLAAGALSVVAYIVADLQERYGDD